MKKTVASIIALLLLSTTAMATDDLKKVALEAGLKPIPKINLH